MKVFYGIRNLENFRKSVVSIGVFDGVHRGHAQILKAAKKKALSIGGISAAITFWPHPQKEQSLYSLNHRLSLLADLGVDLCVVVNFNNSFSMISAEDFVKKFVVEKLSAKYVFVGDNFHFGRKAQSGTDNLLALSKKYNFKLKLFKVLKCSGKNISSTYIRRLIKKGRLFEAQKLLGRQVSILGTVIRGRSIARSLGFPTANIDPHHEVIPPAGVYAVVVFIDSKKFKGVCNIGIKPTLRENQINDRNIHIEVHIFNFSKQLYAKDIQINFIRKIRRERKFPSFLQLSAQIKKDIVSARRIISIH